MERTSLNIEKLVLEDFNVKHIIKKENYDNIET